MKRSVRVVAFSIPLFCLVWICALQVRALTDSSSVDGTVRALFDLARPDTAPFPTDIFTVADASQNTGRRLSLPYPDCTVRPSDCDDLDVVNALDGFGLQPQLSIPFDGPIDAASVNSDAVFLIDLGSTLEKRARSHAVIGINQIVWDTFTQTLHVEADQLLAQHTRYALIATSRLRDTEGKRVKADNAFRRFRHTVEEPYRDAQLEAIETLRDTEGKRVKADFRRFRHTVEERYRDALLEAIEAAGEIGIPEHDIVSASVFTTQSITSVMERIRDQIKAGVPQPANFRLGPMGEPAVFTLANVSGISWKQHTRLNPDGFTPASIDLGVLRVVPGAIGTIAYGYYVSPDYNVHPGEYIPAVGTRTGTPLVQDYNKIYFTLMLPAGSKPPNGWPIALVAGGTTGNQHFTAGNFASKLAAHGIATIGINHVGQGFGLLGTLTVSMSGGSSMTIPDAGRGIDQNGDNVITNTEGSEAAGPRAWTISLSDANRQTVIDLMQLVRVIEAGMDVDGNGDADIDPSRISFLGASAGTMIGTIFMALDPSVPVGVAAAVPGVIPEHARWQPNRRPLIGLSLQARTPSLINAPGLMEIDGVAVAGPYFNENKPLRNQPPVINTVDGAVAIQHALELSEMASQAGLSPAVWARYLREAPLPGVHPKSVMYEFATGDQQAVNPGTTAVIRAGNLADRTLYYRHDFASAQDPTMPKNPHMFAGSPTSPNALFRSISRAVQDQIGTFLASGGTVIIHPEPAYFFEVPITSSLPETLNFIR